MDSLKPFSLQFLWKMVLSLQEISISQRNLMLKGNSDRSFQSMVTVWLFSKQSSGTLFKQSLNYFITRLIINGMKLQKCQPSFFDARDASIQADQVLTGGENFCEIWEGFSERGLGQDATVIGRTPWGGGIRTNVSFALFELS